jgi:DNA modification methylase
MEDASVIDILHGDCRDIMAAMPPAIFDSCVTDPPYHLTNNTGTRSPYPGQYTPIGRPQEPKGGFMGRAWDGGSIAFQPETWAAVLRVLKPGAHLLAFGGMRTQHRLICAIEDAGFEIRDCLLFLYGTGFPKNHNVSAALKRSLPADALCVCAPDYPRTTQGFPDDCRSYRDCDDERPHAAQDGGQGVPPSPTDARGHNHAGLPGDDPGAGRASISPGAANGHPSNDDSSRRGKVSHGSLFADNEPPGKPSSTSDYFQKGPRKKRPDKSGKLHSDDGLADASALSDANLPRCPICNKLRVPEGLGSALKPAVEMICLARKPFRGTVAANIITYGTGAINVDACRIGTTKDVPASVSRARGNSLSGSVDGTLRNQTGDESGFDPNIGRWPANVVHDGSPEVEAAFATFGERTSGGITHQPTRSGYSEGWSDGTHVQREPDTGTASRFFYTAKPTAADRADSKHPTVKPVALIRWLVRLVTPPGGTVLDPFAGSGTTGEAAMREGCDAILIEREAEHVADIRHRVKRWHGGDLPLFAEIGA